MCRAREKSRVHTILDTSKKMVPRASFSRRTKKKDYVAMLDSLMNMMLR